MKAVVRIFPSIAATEFETYPLPVKVTTVSAFAATMDGFRLFNPGTGFSTVRLRTFELCPEEFKTLTG